MKVWTKGWGIVCLIMAVFFALAGCNKTAKTDAAAGGDTQTLEAALFLGGYAGFWEYYIPKFEAENPGVTVKYELSNTLEEMLRPRMMTDDVPDFVAINLTNAFDPRILARDGLVLDMTSFLAETTINGVSLEDHLIEGMLDQGTINGKKYLLPQNLTMMGLFYNKKLVRDLGITLPETYDDLLAIGEKVAAAKMPGVYLFTYSGIDVSYVNDGMLKPTWGNIWEDIAANKSGVWNSPEVIQAFQYFKTMGERRYIDPSNLGIDYLQTQQDFLTGKALFHSNGDWLENEMADTQLVNFEWGFIPSLALKKGDTRYLNVNHECMFIPAKAKNPELAKKFLAGVYTDENVKAIAEITGAVIPVKNALDLVSGYVSSSYGEMLLGQAETGAVSKIVSAPPEMAPVFNEVNIQLNKVIDGSATAEQAAAAVAAVAREISF
ncbi:MAG: extracellular solute-binding protein [Spirochaetaceae bacterium]|jgi:N-acetylglucosamine transport system substrate-binding protein|nr:extracellular solute-binding protein [Spirochaetaceae bacterium]